MIALIQRVRRAHVEVDGATVGAIDAGLLALVAVQPGDGEAQAQTAAKTIADLQAADEASRGPAPEIAPARVPRNEAAHKDAGPVVSGPTEDESLSTDGNNAD